MALLCECYTMIVIVTVTVTVRMHSLFPDYSTEVRVNADSSQQPLLQLEGFFSMEPLRQ